MLCFVLCCGVLGVLCRVVLFCVVLLSYVVSVLGRFLLVLGVSWVDFWSCWGVFGGVLGGLGRLLGRLGSLGSF